MTRGRHALVAAVRDDNKILLGEKKLYPPGIVRFPGGGIDAQESALQGAAREIQEELGVTVHTQELSHLADFTAEISSATAAYTFHTSLFTFDLKARAVQASDDLDGVVFYDVHELRELAKRYTQLSTDLIDLQNGQGPFRWSDYGKLYGKIHGIAADLLEKRLFPAQ